MSKVFHVLLGQIRALLVFFDSVVYGFIPILYKLLLYLANIDLVSDNVPIQSLIQRIYILVGVFMLFRLSFSIMNYIIDPDSFSDNAKGFTNLVKRVIIAIVLLVSIPWIFQEAYVVQGKILTSGIIPRFILGEAVSYENGERNSYLEDTINTSAVDVQFLLYGPFFSLNYNAEEFKDACTPDSSNSSVHILGTSGMASKKECLEAVANSMDEDDTVITSGIRLNDFFRYDSDDDGVPIDERKFSSFGGLASWTTNDGEFAINYYPVVSFLCGGYLVFLLLSFCIDVASRIIRLLFLQVLSPVAVISSIDPTSSGDRLKEWGKECLKTWASLFLRLLVIFLIIQLVRVITNTVYSGNNGFTVEGFSNENGVNVWIYIFLLLGIFSAAKKIPELIEKATGLKMSGELELNPFKNPWIAGATGLGLTGVGALGANFIGAIDRTGKLWGDAFDKRKALSTAKKDLDSGMNDLSARSQQYNSAHRNYNKALDDFNKNPTEANFKKAEMAEKIRNYTKQKKDDAQRTYDQLEAKVNKASKEYAEATSKKNIIHNVTQTASAVAGIPAGGVSGAVRGAIGGYKAGNVLGAVSAASSARATVTDKRNDRDVIADTYRLRDRVSETISRYANIKGSKHYGSGRIDDDIKGLKNELSNVQQQLSEANRIITRQLQNASSITDSNLKNLVTELRSSSDSSSRNEILNNINNAISNLPSGDPNADIVRSIAESFKIQDDLMNVNIDISKQISKLQDAMSAGHGGGPKSGGN